MYSLGLTNKLYESLEGRERTSEKKNIGRESLNDIYIAMHKQTHTDAQTHRQCDIYCAVCVLLWLLNVQYSSPLISSFKILFLFSAYHQTFASFPTLNRLLPPIPFRLLFFFFDTKLSTNIKMSQFS